MPSRCLAILGNVSLTLEPLATGEFVVEVVGALTVSFFGQPYVIDNYSSDLQVTVVENPNPIPGCTYELASNYVVFATIEDGSCVFAGCTDANANNFEKFATVDDGSCDYTPCSSGCLTDLDSDGFTTTSDLLLFLGEFGEACEQ